MDTASSRLLGRRQRRTGGCISGAVMYGGHRGHTSRDLVHRETAGSESERCWVMVGLVFLPRYHCLCVHSELVIDLAKQRCRVAVEQCWSGDCGTRPRNSFDGSDYRSA